MIRDFIQCLMHWAAHMVKEVFCCLGETDNQTVKVSDRSSARCN